MTGCISTDPCPVVELERLSIRLPGKGDRRHAVEDVSFSVMKGEVLCVVGESGSGKSVTSQAIMGLLPSEFPRAEGAIRFEGEELISASAERRRALRGQAMGMIFQEPMTALNPVYKIGEQIDEVIRTHVRMPTSRRADKVCAALAEVGLPDPASIAHAYPHQLSGGQRQRVLIAAAMILEPKLLVADEPTTALDVTTQAQILDKIRELQARRGMGVLFITHDIGVVADIADRIVVMRNGRVVEIGAAQQVLGAPREDYTRMLIDAVPSLHEGRETRTLGPPVLRAEGVAKIYESRSLFGRSRRVDALKPTTLMLGQGETLGVIGESGSGKSTLARCITRLIAPTAGEVALSAPTEGNVRVFRQRLQIVFQDPYRSLNPRRTVGQSVIEGPVNFGMSKTEARQRAADLMQLVQLDPDALDRYPHQFSGGQRQRISIARALAMEPEVLIADEAVSALDVSVQARVLDLLEDIQRRLSLSILFITHDLRVAAKICDRLMVMHCGEVVEEGPAMRILSAPEHEYTRCLLASVPGRGLSPAEAVAMRTGSQTTTIQQEKRSMTCLIDRN